MIDSPLPGSANPTLGDVDVSAMLASRPAHPAAYEAESMVMAELVEVLANRPRELAQSLANAAMTLTGAESAGVSLEQEHQGEPIFRWIATAGEYARYLHGTMPRNYSPCGSVVDRCAPILMREPIKVFPYIEVLHAPVREVLLVPFYRAGVPVGTVWAVHHGDQQFDQEDLRVLRAVTNFAGAAMQSVGLASSLEQADQQKDKFLAMLAHELRNPLMPIGIAVQMLKQLPGQDPRQAKYLAMIEKQTRTLGSLIDDITDGVSIRSGKISLNRAPTSLQRIVEDALEVSGGIALSKKQTLEVSIPETSIALSADGSRMAQALINLLNNASKYTGEGGSISLSCAVEDGCAVLQVRDSGMGIAPEMLGRVFDMFMQVPMEDRPEHSGLGIGLALVRQIVELHGGQVSASSAGLGQGSTFTIRWPI